MRFRGAVMGGQVLEHVRSGPLSGAARRSLVVACACLLCASVGVAALSAGCDGNSGVKMYVTEANQILADVSAKAAAVKKIWGVPLADQAEMQKALTDYRKSLGSAQDKLDKIKMPEQCLNLDDLLRQMLQKGREVADLSAPYTDYLTGAAPCANLAASIVSELQSLENEDDIASGLAGLTDKARQLEADVRTISTPAIFVGMNQEFDDFAKGVLSAFESASGKASSEVSHLEQDSTPYDEGQTTEASQPSRKKSGSSSLTSLSDLPDDWARFNGQLSVMLGAVRDVMGLNARSAEVENLVGQAQAEIKTLEQKYK